jgi:hypothetical protein
VKTFYCAEDIEGLAAQGRTELVVDENTVLTDLARDAARQLGISVKYRTQANPVAVVPSGPSSGLSIGATVSALGALGAKPKGCQHGPLDVEAVRPASATGSSGGVVDQLVDAVKRLGEKPGS